jgi:hypothetical protein
MQGRLFIQTNNVTFPSGSIGLRVVDTHAVFFQLQMRPLAETMETAPGKINLQKSGVRSSDAQPVGADR